ncbi:Sensor histidine kinase RcsC [Sporomusa rhizae]|uniref:ATP-binding protein n=1 Tax=Sporomusa rhizae TaxID=357999 RepID=UPI00352AF03B
MGFKRKLLLAFGSIILLMVMFLGIAVVLTYQLNDNINEAIKDKYEKGRKTSVIDRSIYSIDGSLKNLVISSNDDKRQSALTEIEKSQGEQKIALESYARAVTNPRILEILPKLKATLDNYEYLTQEIIRLTKAGQHTEAARLLMSDGQTIVTRAINLTQELRTLQERIMVDTLEEATTTYKMAELFLVICSITSVIIGVGITIRVIGSVTSDLRKMAKVINSVRDSKAKVLPRISIYSRDEIGSIAKAFNEMVAVLEWHRIQEKEFIAAMEAQSWLKSQLAEMFTLLQGVSDHATLGKDFINKLAPTLGANYGVVYIVENDGGTQWLNKLASYADSGDTVGVSRLRMGEGIIGQCAVQNRSVILDQVPEGYIKLTSGLGSAKPDYIVALPVCYEDKVLAVVELAGFGQLTEIHTQYIQQVMKNIAVILTRVTSQMQAAHLLIESQTFAEELQSQSEELQQQQEELKIINERLEEQYRNSEHKTKALEQAKAELEERTRQLDLSSRYKTEFLANMSHELRTPLNSLLILAQALEANRDNNLTAKQLEYVRTIYSAGNDLLLLINDILDLSKLDSGKLTINMELMHIANMTADLVNQFKPVAERSELDFIVEIDKEIQAAIYTDKLRLQQILKNLLSNAFKFTEKGWVKLWIKKAANPDWLVFEVSDSGIGIPPDKQTMIFEAFRQVDGTASRKYGGTGLGLSISRELSRLLGGCISLESKEGYGSTFALYLPSRASLIRELPNLSTTEAASTIAEDPVLPTTVEAASRQRNDSSEATLAGKKVLIIDDDMCNVYALVAAMEVEGIVPLFTKNSRDGLPYLREYADIELIIIDNTLLELDNYEVIQNIRKRPEFYELPILVLTAKKMIQDGKRCRCMEMGASDYISKPVNLDQLFSLLRVWLNQ